MLRILTGRAGSGKTTMMKNEIINRLNDNKDDKNIILFVPEQMTFQAEYEIAKKVTGKTYSRLQVFSFKRMAYRIFLEVGGLNKTFINDITVEMMITKIIEEKKDTFLLYNKLSANHSFVQLVHRILKEFKSYQVTPDVISHLIENEKMDETLKKKLHDISIIYNELNQLYHQQLLDREDFYQALADNIKKSTYIKNVDIYIDGYHQFTTVELNVIKEMMLVCSNMTILFTLDNPSQIDMSDEDHLFNLPFKTFMKIKNFALDNEMKMEIKHLPNYNLKRFNQTSLYFLEQHYEKQRVYEGDVKGIKVIENENPTSEVHAVARMIYQDILENNLTFSDYVIYINNQEVYYPLIQNIFSLYDIPVFIDDKKLMLDHSLLNFIDATLEAIKTNLSYEAMFRAIKTEILIPLHYHGTTLNENNYPHIIRDYRKRIDLLENYCLSHGIRGTDWEKEEWELDIYKKLGEKNRNKTKKESELESVINETKNEISRVMLEFKKRFVNADTVKEQITAIYELLVEINVEKKLDLYEQINMSGEDVDLNEAKKHKQVYNQLMELFDELVLVCGEYQVNTNDLIKILRTGFKGMKFAIVPPAIDQVMVGAMKRSRFEMLGHFDDPKTMGVKKAIVLGVNENEIPKVQYDSGLITSKEREFILNQDIELTPTIETAFLEEYFIIYSVLCSASDELILSYHLSSHDKKEAYRSEVIEKILQMFPKLKVKTIYDFPQKEEDNLCYVTTKSMTSKLVLQAIHLLRKGYEVNDLWKALYGYYKHHHSLSERLLGVTYVNESVPIEKEQIKQVFGETINASISSVEKYNNCPYAYYLERGLQLKTRDIQNIEPVDIGDLYHETMKEVALLLIQNNKKLHELPLDNMNQLVNQIVDNFSYKIGRKYFKNNKKNAYLLYKIKQSLLKSIQNMVYQSKHDAFKILAVEEKFGHDAKRLQVAPLQLKTGFKMNLKGYIDRIDVANLDDEIYVRIIDYKSGNRDIDFNKIYHRLSLQLFTYLDVVLNNAKVLFNQEAKPAGVLYYQIQNSEIKADKELEEDEIISKHHEQYKMNGYTLGDQKVSTLFDNQLKEKKKSDIVKVTLTKTGYHKTQSKVLTVDEINALRQYTRRSLIQSMEDITSGRIDIKPVMYQKLSHCKYCEYHSICKFDAKLRENDYHEIRKTGDTQDVIQKILEEFGSEKK